MSALIANSEEAQEVGAAIMRFQSHVPDEAAEITALVAECFAVSAALLELHSALKDRRNASRVHLIDEDKYVVLRSMEYTFKDTMKKVGKLGRYDRDSEGFPAVWKEMTAYFLKENETTLRERMDCYKRFLHDITLVVNGEHPSSEIDELHDDIDDLLQIQDDRLADDMDKMTIGTPRVRSWERVRPHGVGIGGGGGGSGSGEGPSRRPGGNRKNRYQQPTAFDRHSTQRTGGNYYSSTAVEVPSSPTTSTQSSSIGSAAMDHWLPAVFTQYRPTTVFRYTSSESVCCGEDAPGAVARLRIEHEKLLTLPLEPSGSFEVCFYLRPFDSRARILCRMDRGASGGGASGAGKSRSLQTTCVMPLTMLKIHRDDSCLRLCKQDSRGRLLLWAALRFPSYERLVIFFCAFLALKCQDEAFRPASRNGGGNGDQLDDHVLDDEIPVFKGKIIEDNTTYMLELFKDSNSLGMRMQASSCRSATRWMPVWTAFITYSIQNVKWIRQVEARKVHLFDLNRFVYVNDYVPGAGPNGENELYFTTKEDARLFCEAINDLATGKV